jgi:cell division septation protein DedD
MNSDSSELVTLVATNDPVEAEIILGKLRSAGIDAYIRHEAVSNVIGLTFDGVGRQEVIVRADELVEAQVALEQVLQEPGESAE